ncbi:MAG: hypothetical protein YFSK_0580 [Candidatus Yanofskyibacterium parasiticum]|jgi:hypothetical protein|nr:MAG: hypothetical protein YFSK_0580 [Candidatus Yanofskybacteria bacterium]
MIKYKAKRTGALTSPVLLIVTYNLIIAQAVALSRENIRENIK